MKESKFAKVLYDTLKKVLLTTLWYWLDHKILTFFIDIRRANSYKEFDLINFYIYQVYQGISYIKNMIKTIFTIKMPSYWECIWNAIEYLVDVNYSRQI